MIPVTKNLSTNWNDLLARIPIFQIVSWEFVDSNLIVQTENFFLGYRFEWIDA